MCACVCIHVVHVGVDCFDEILGCIFLKEMVEKVSDSVHLKH